MCRYAADGVVYLHVDGEGGAVYTATIAEDARDSVYRGVFRAEAFPLPLYLTSKHSAETGGNRDILQSWHTTLLQTRSSYMTTVCKDKATFDFPH